MSLDEGLVKSAGRYIMPIGSESEGGKVTVSPLALSAAVWFRPTRGGQEMI